VFQQLHGLSVQEEEFIPFGGMGENRFLGGIADKYHVKGFDIEAAKRLFFDIFINKYAKPEYNIGFPGEFQLWIGFEFRFALCAGQMHTAHLVLLLMCFC
jgi:hypothetical protein